jgi:hypothetical protein
MPFNHSYRIDLLQCCQLLDLLKGTGELREGKVRAPMNSDVWERIHAMNSGVWERIHESI